MQIFIRYALKYNDLYLGFILFWFNVIDNMKYYFDNILQEISRIPAFIHINNLQVHIVVEVIVPKSIYSCYVCINWSSSPSSTQQCTTPRQIQYTCNLLHNWMPESRKNINLFVYHYLSLSQLYHYLLIYWVVLMSLLCKAVLILLQDAQFATMLKRHWLCAHNKGCLWRWN